MWEILTLGKPCLDVFKIIKRKNYRKKEKKKTYKDNQTKREKTYERTNRCLVAVDIHTRNVMSDQKV